MFKKQDFSLRLVENFDKELLLQWRNQERIRRNLYTDHLIGKEEHDRWFSGILKDESKIYLICDFKNNPVGLVCFTEIDKQNSKCNWGFYLGEESSPKGCGFVMEFLALEYIFDFIKVRKLCCEIFAFNTAVIKQHKRFGFTEEGCLKKHILKNNQYEDIVQMALFEYDWQKFKQSISDKYFEDNSSTHPH